MLTIRFHELEGESIHNGFVLYAVPVISISALSFIGLSCLGNCKFHSCLHMTKPIGFSDGDSWLLRTEVNSLSITAVTLSGRHPWLINLMEWLDVCSVALFLDSWC